MTTIKYVLLVLALATVLFTACGDSDDTTAPVDPLTGAALCISDSICSLNAQCDTSMTVTVFNCGNSAVLDWTAVCDSSWLSLSTLSGSTTSGFKMVVDSNRSGAERSATVSVTVTGLTDSSAEITVTQPTFGASLAVSLAQWQVPSLGGDGATISITNSGNDVSLDWSVTDDLDWLSLSAVSGSTPYDLTVVADTNNTGMSRSGTITVTSDGIAGSPWEIAVEQPSVLEMIGSYNTTSWTSAVSASGNYAYAAVYSYLQIFDVSDLSSPILIGSYGLPDFVRDIFVAGDYVYVVDDISGLSIVDVSNPNAPTLAWSYSTIGWARGVFVLGDYAFVASGDAGLKIFDVSNPSSPTVAGSCVTPDWAGRVFVLGDYAYVAMGNSGLQVIDVSNPSSPSLAGSYDTPDYANDVFVVGDYAFVADQEGDGLQVIDVSNPSSPTLAGSYDTPNEARSVFVSGDFAYVADDESGILVIDISDPSNPSLAGSFDTPSFAVDVFVEENLAYVADGDESLLIFEIAPDLVD